jgi:hypothetical protein
MQSELDLPGKGMAGTGGEEAGLLRGVAEEGFVGNDLQVHPRCSLGRGVYHTSEHQEPLLNRELHQKLFGHHALRVYLMMSFTSAAVLIATRTSGVFATACLRIKRIESCE